MHISRRTFLRNTGSLALQGGGGNLGVVNNIWKTSTSALGTLQSYERMMGSVMGIPSDPRYWWILLDKKSQPEKNVLAATVSRLVSNIMPTITEGNIDELFDSIFHLDTHTAALIFTRNFHRFTDEQIRKSLQHICFDAVDEKRELHAGYEKLDLDVRNHEYAYSDQLIGQWLMRTTDTNFQRFISLLSDDTPLDNMSNFRQVIMWFLGGCESRWIDDTELGTRRIIEFFHKVSHTYKGLVLEGITDDLEPDALNAAFIEYPSLADFSGGNLLLSTVNQIEYEKDQLMKHLGGVEKVFSLGKKSTGWEYPELQDQYQTGVKNIMISMQGVIARVYPKVEEAIGRLVQENNELEGERDSLSQDILTNPSIELTQHDPSSPPSSSPYSPKRSLPV